MSDIFDVVADETRREILNILLESTLAGAAELSVSDLVARTGLSQPTVSKQLKVLREAGLVRVREEGQHRLYHLDATPLEELEMWVIPFLGTEISEEELADVAGERLLGEDTLAVAESVGSAAATVAFNLTQAWGDLSGQVKTNAGKLSEQLRKASRRS